MSAFEGATPVLSYRNSIVEDEPMLAMAEQSVSGCDSSGSADSEQDLSNAALASCLYDHRVKPSELFSGLAMILVGVGVGTVACLNPTQNPHHTPAFMVGGLVMGGVCAAIGTVLLVFRSASRSHGIEVTDVGLNYVKKKSVLEFRWDEIHKILVTHFSGGAGHAAELICKVTPKRGKSFNIRTGSYLGDPAGVIDALLTNCDYIVRNPEAYEKNIQ